MYIPYLPQRSHTQSRPVWRAVVAIVMLAALLFPSTGSSATPVAQVAENLLGSDITVSPSTLAPGEKATVTVALRNTGSADAAADVTVVLPSELAYVDGSVTGGGNLQDGNVVWTGVPVAAHTSVPLTFQVTPAVQVSTNTVVTTVAAIMSEYLHLIRFAQITLVPSGPPPTPSPNLAGSYKSASQYTLAPGEVLTYTIKLINSGTANAVATVVDPVPTPVNYVADSVTGSGTYDLASKTLSWTDVAVPAGGDVSLSFAVTTTAAFETLVTNTATISVTGNGSFQRHTWVLLVPEPRPSDAIPPVVHSLTIAEQDVLTSPEVTLHISATDNVAVTQMRLREWQLTTAPFPHWELVSSTDWIPFQADYPWTLGSAAGTHFVGVWVRDAAHNTSLLDENAVDFASLLQPATRVSQGGSVPYLVYYEAGVDVSATLTSIDGTADLFVWYPRDYLGPDRTDNSVTFTTPRAGVYLFLVHGRTSATYDLSISPGGGAPSSAAMTAMTAAGQTETTLGANAVTTGNVSNPLVTSGLSPLGDLTAPADPSSLAGEYLVNSDITASQSTLAYGQVLTFTVTLRNTGDAGAVVSVTVVLSSALAYVPGSVTDGGSLQDGNVVWTGVPVAAHTSMPLSFQVTPAMQVSADTQVTTFAPIMSEHLHIIRWTTITLVPSPLPPGPNLTGSYKSASRDVVTAGQVLTYSIHLRNSGTIGAAADVTDAVPAHMTYVPGSVTGGGNYDPGTTMLSWSSINVAPGADVVLSFAVTVATVDVPTFVTNTATIAAGGGSFGRTAGVLLAPKLHRLAGSYKSASQNMLAPGETLTFTIKLINSGTEDALVDVTDPVPAELSYIPGSSGGSYNPGTKTLSWNDVTVPSKDEVSLSFAVTMAAQVNVRTKVINTATISVTGDSSFQRHAHVLLVPESVPTDDVPPVVHRLTIDAQDVLTSPTVTLHISATDNVAVTKMYLQEWYLATTPFPHWQVVHTSGWVPFQADYAWTLAAESGTHFVGVWVADGALNVSLLDRRAIDFASLLLPGETVPHHGLVPYLVRYSAGVSVNATLAPTSGDADLYVWYPGSLGLPDQKSTQPGTATDSVSFTTPRAGTYLFMVYGYSAATYNLSITSGGGPGLLAASQAMSSKPGELTSEPVLSQSGLDPLASTETTQTIQVIYLPMVFRNAP